MSALAILRQLAALRRAERLSQDALRALQESKLRRIVTHAFATVPFWRRVMQAAGIAPEDVRTLDDLAWFPVTTRAMLQQVPSADRTSSAFDPARLRPAMTTGSTGRPLTVYLDRRFHILTRASFLRALMTAGLFPGERTMLLAHERGRAVPSWLRWSYVSPDLPGEALAVQLARLAPKNIYGWVTPLRQLAWHLRQAALPIARPRRLFTTAEAVDEQTGRLLDEQLAAERFAIYGSTELGPIGWECGAHAGYHLAEDTTILEFLEVPGGGGLYRIVATSLEALATPLIRYDTGDLALLPQRSPCACGRRLARLQRIEGRLVDSVRLADGRLLSPYLLTEAVERLPGLVRYQIVQEALDHFTLRAEGEPADRAAVEAGIARTIREAVGSPVAVEVCWEEDLDPPPGRKFRVVESRVA